MEETREFRYFGPPGCGKTYNLTQLAHKTVEKYGSDSLLIASFTKTAAAEIAGRGLPVEKEQIGTLHAHCYRALGRPPVAETMLEEWNTYAPEYSLSGEGKANVDEDVAEQHFGSTGDLLFNQYGLMRNKLTPRDVWPQSLRAFASKFEDWKQATGCLDFTDMIERAYLDVDTAPGNPKIAMIDEVQDCVPLELQLVRSWGKNLETLVLSGDDDQCIYHFKGASPKSFLFPPVPDSQKRVLSQSYRVPRAVQLVAQRLIEKVSIREPKVYNPRDEEGEVRLLQQATWRNPEAAVLDAERYLADGKSVMFLTTCSFMLEPLKQVLKKSGIPFHNPFRKSRGDWNPLTPERGTSSAQRLLAYLRPDNATWGAEARMWTPDDMARWIELVKAKGILKKGAKGRLETMDGTGELDIATLLEFFEKDALMQAMECNLDWLENNLLSAKQKAMEFPLMVARTRGAGALREEPRVLLGTGHSVKGGESSVVYVFPDLSMAGQREFLGSREAKDSIIRLFYVMTTRAKESLVLCGPATPYHVKLNGLLK